MVKYAHSINTFPTGLFAFHDLAHSHGGSAGCDHSHAHVEEQAPGHSHVHDASCAHDHGDFNSHSDGHTKVSVGEPVKKGAACNHAKNSNISGVRAVVCSSRQLECDVSLLFVMTCGYRCICTLWLTRSGRSVIITAHAMPPQQIICCIPGISLIDRCKSPVPQPHTAQPTFLPGVIISTVLIQRYGWTWTDAFMSIMIAVLIFVRFARGL
jgi:hypothetical protein